MCGFYRLVLTGFSGKHYRCMFVPKMTNDLTYCFTCLFKTLVFHLPSLDSLPSCWYKTRGVWCFQRSTPVQSVFPQDKNVPKNLYLAMYVSVCLYFVYTLSCGGWLAELTSSEMLHNTLMQNRIPCNCAERHLSGSVHRSHSPQVLYLNKYTALKHSWYIYLQSRFRLRSPRKEATPTLQVYKHTDKTHSLRANCSFQKCMSSS